MSVSRFRSRLQMSEPRLSHEIEFSFLNGNLMVPAGYPPIFHMQVHIVCEHRKVQINQNRRSVMKKLITIVALSATLISAPALTSTLAMAAGHSVHSANAASNVYNTRGHYVGSDPDPFIRDQLARDPR